MENIAIFLIVGAVLALVATILAFVYIVPEKRRVKLNKFGKFLHDTVNFKFLIIEKILQALYIFATALVIFSGFFMLFYVQEGYTYHSYYSTYTTPSIWYGGYGLLLMILGPIVIRLGYEFLMMAILLVKNVIQINSKLKSESKEGSEEQFKAPEMNQSETAKVAFCPNCGTKMGDGAFCTKCGYKS